MPKLSELQLSDITGKTRLTIKRKLADVPHEEGPHKARLYDSKVALEAIYIGLGESSTGDAITAAEAQRQLTIARKHEIDLNMEVTRRERIPLEDIEEANERVLSNVAGLIKAHVGKPLDEALVSDIFAELRNMNLAARDEG